MASFAGTSGSSLASSDLSAALASGIFSLLILSSSGSFSLHLTPRKPSEKELIYLCIITNHFLGKLDYSNLKMAHVNSTVNRCEIFRQKRVVGVVRVIKVPRSKSRPRHG